MSSLIEHVRRTTHQPLSVLSDCWNHLHLALLRVIPSYSEYLLLQPITDASVLTRPQPSPPNYHLQLREFFYDSVEGNRRSDLWSKLAWPPCANLLVALFRMRPTAGCPSHPNSNLGRLTRSRHRSMFTFCPGSGRVIGGIDLHWTNWEWDQEEEFMYI
jgi:hypothetical protein